MFKNSTFPETFNIFFDLLYTKFSAIIINPSLVSAFPYLVPTTRLPSSTISISVILNLNSSCAAEKLKKLIIK